jgi:hypothetical protein
MQINNLSTAVVQRRNRPRLKAKPFNGSPQLCSTRSWPAASSPEVHGVLDWPLAAIIIAGPIVFDFDSTAATVSARVRRRCRRARGGHGVADWDRAGYPAAPSRLRGRHRDRALIPLPFVLGFDDSTAALLSYGIVGGAGLAATLATRLEPRVPEARAMMSRRLREAITRAGARRR